MKTLTEYTDNNYFEGNISEGLFDWFMNLFKRSKSNVDTASARKLLPFKGVKADAIKMTKKPLNNLKAFKTAVKEEHKSYPQTSKILQQMGKWLNAKNEKIDEKKMRFITFAYKPEDSFKNEIYTCAVAGYLMPDEQIVDKTRFHILFFEGNENIIMNWKQIEDDIFTGFIENTLKPKARDKISMYYANNAAKLPKYQGKSFEEIAERKDPVAILEV